MSSLSNNVRRFIPESEFQADLARSPVDDSCVTPRGLSDHEELRDWQQAQSHVEFDADFGASMLEPDREEIAEWDLQRAMAPMLSRWTNTQLMQLVSLAEWTGTPALVAAATAELSKRVTNRKG